MHAARAKSGPSAARSLDGRVRERGEGVPILHSTTRVTHRPDPSRALHARPRDGNALECVGDPLAGRMARSGLLRPAWAGPGLARCTQDGPPPPPLTLFPLTAHNTIHLAGEPERRAPPHAADACKNFLKFLGIPKFVPKF